MESVLKCPACKARVRPADEWCPLCYARLAVPAPAVSTPAIPTQTGPSQTGPAQTGPAQAGPVQDPVQAAPDGTATPSLPQGRRARREDLDQLAEVMLSQLAASQPAATLPGRAGRMLGAIGLEPGSGGARKAVGIAVVCATMVALFTTLSWIAGLVL